MLLGIWSSLSSLCLPGINPIELSPRSRSELGLLLSGHLCTFRLANQSFPPAIQLLRKLKGSWIISPYRGHSSSSSKPFQLTNTNLIDGVFIRMYDRLFPLPVEEGESWKLFAIHHYYVHNKQAINNLHK